MSKKEYENVAEFFYSRASKRIKEKIGDKRHKDIHYADSKQISRIINNNRGRNNRFLIPDSVIETYYKDECCDIKGVIADFLRWLKDNDLFDVFVSKWKAK